MLHRILNVSDESMRAGFAHGGPALMMPPSLERLEKKKDLLRRFKSENSELLVRYFGYPDLFRQLNDPDAALRMEKQISRSLINFGGRKIGISLLLLWLGLWITSLSICATLIDLIASMTDSHSRLIALIAVGFFVVVCAILFGRDRIPERRFLWAACAAGFLLAEVIQ